MPSTSTRWCFTLNNPTEDEKVYLRSTFEDASQVRFAIFGHEVAETGTPHLQGYVVFTSTKRPTGAKKVLCGRSHVEFAKGNEQQNIDYCSKEGQVEEFGTRKAPGKRTDMEAFMQAVKNGQHDYSILRDQFPIVCARYPRFVTEYIRDSIPVPEVPDHSLRPWQERLTELLSEEPDDRRVIFVVDYQGNKGKSWFAHDYMKKNENCILLRPTKHADMAYALPLVLKTVFFDCTRKQVEYLPYTLMEELKDGYVMSSKYESCMKRFPNMHVVVLMNEDPDMKALSMDRYYIINLDDNNYN